jgi:steroid delta-isomerase-like uncharacterized protein
MTIQQTQAEQHKALIRRWVEDGWNKGDLDSADAIYADTYIGYGIDVSGREGLKQFVAMFRAAFPDLHFSIQDMLAEGSKVAWRYTLHGTQHGEFQGIPPTGKPVKVTGIVISRFDNGMWAEDWVEADRVGMLQQLGVIPAVEAAGA